MISVIVPAHNEAAVIARSLRALVEGAEPDEIEVVVTCNGCTDATAEHARNVGGPIKVLELPTPSKIDALNAGDGICSGFPRFYCDADVLLPLDSVRRIATALEAGPLLAAAPRLRIDLRSSSTLVRAYYRVWSLLPSVTNDLVGRGVYAVSEAGRDRFDVFPHLIADDHFIRSIFEPHERGVVPGTFSVVSGPKTFAGLIRRRTRVREGNIEASDGITTTRPRELISIARRQPRRIPDLGVFALVTAIVRFVVLNRRMRGQVGWLRDDSRVDNEA